jgi:hypothetical protein
MLYIVMEAWKGMPFPAALAGAAQLRASVTPAVSCMVSVLNHTRHHSWRARSVL